MADKRRLYSEIDKLLKKINDGKVDFDQTMEKYRSAPNNTQKERFEGELKKKIKQLQRYREQIKTWQGNNEIKDKRDTLDEARTLIETYMEKFKVIEKETKTKAYSKEGLETETKKDPIQRERDEIREFLQTIIDTLNKSVEKLEYEIEQLSMVNKKKRPDKEKLAQAEEKKARLENVGFHIGKLELCLGALFNESLDLEKFRCNQETIEYYLGSAEENEMELDEAIYDEFISEDADVTISNLNLMDPADASNTSGESRHAPLLSETEFEPFPAITSESLVALPDPTNNNNNGSSSSIRSCIPEAVPSPSIALAPSPQSSVLKPVISPCNFGPFDVPPPPSVSMRPQQPPLPPFVPVNDFGASTFMDDCGMMEDRPELSMPPRPIMGMESKPPGMHQQQGPPNMLGSARSTQNYFGMEKQFVRQASSSMFPNVPPPPPQQKLFAPPPPPPNDSNGLLYSQMRLRPAPNAGSLPSNVKNGSVSLKLEPIDAVAPFRNENFKLDDLNRRLADGYAKRTRPQDSNRARMTLLKNPPTYDTNYPKEPLNDFNNDKYFEKLDPLTLFFIFYYFEGSRAQFLASQTLKRKAWRFHKKDMLWYQRHEEPHDIESEFETGTYIYYDVEAKSTRTKENFRFDYCYLEDGDTP